MSLNCGIVGLPNVGKSTIFHALTSSKAEVANYPFCTIEPNIGICNVDDKRLKKIADIIKPAKVIPSIVEIVDIAGLVKGASLGEGLGNQFLGHIRGVNAIVQVVRCFDDENVIHVDGRVDPISDITVINDELILADLEVVERKLEGLPKLMRNHKKEISSKAHELLPILKSVRGFLENGRCIRDIPLNESDKKLIDELNLITSKPTLYLCNVDENSLHEDNGHVTKIREIVSREKFPLIKICGKLESEIASLESEEEKRELLKMAELNESGLDMLTRECYRLLGFQTFFTAGKKEVRAWTFKTSVKAPQAAGIIHSDFERGFIKAEVYHCEDLFEHRFEHKIKEAGKFRIEGKDYVIQDGDVIHFRFNV